VKKYSKISGRKYWRSLTQLNDPAKYKKNNRKEFPGGLAESNGSLARRSFLGFMGASMALAGLAGCRRPAEKIIPYVNPPEEITPGTPDYYATTMPFGSSAYGMVVECHEGRPTKIEGNPLHPSSFGAANTFMQASILGLYDPDRFAKVRHAGKEKTYNDFVTFWQGLRGEYLRNGGAGLAILSESFASPTLSRLMTQFKTQFPNSTIACYEPINNENYNQAIENLAGRKYRPLYHYNKANVILSLDADFLLTESESLTSGKQFASGRNLEKPSDTMNRLYVAESGYSVTGAMADHRLPVPSSQIYPLAVALYKTLVNHNANGRNYISLPDISETIDIDLKWINALTDDLAKNRGRCLIVAGQKQPRHVHEIVIMINEVLGNFGSTINFTKPEDNLVSEIGGFSRLIEHIDNGSIKTLLILGGNPVYNAPVDFAFEDKLKSIKQSVHLSEYYDETSKIAKWHVPLAHFLESWGDARSADGTTSIIQPMIKPLHDGISLSSFWELLATGVPEHGYEAVRETWRNLLGNSDFEKKWRKALHDGVYDKKSPAVNVNITFKPLDLPPVSDIQVDSDIQMEVVFQTSPAVYDGRFGNNGWLQEWPDPITKLAWDNAALISPDTARKHNLQNGDYISISKGDNKLEIPIWILPGQAVNSISISLGYGRKFGGRVADKVGFNAYKIRESNHLSFITDINIRKVGRTHAFANTQDHNVMEGRAIVREATLDEFRHNPNLPAVKIDFHRT
jgi:molybdopterin-containing oxidoreductase family iron-sulfur binding subunit